MPNYIISYDLRKQRNYPKLYECLQGWKAVRLLESVWLAELRGPAQAVRDILANQIDKDDGVVVIELVGQFDWASLRATPGGTAWLKAKSP